MPKKKRHHYIPRFYLKQFSANGEGKSIGLYNHSNNLFVQTASLKHQAYENFLYGEDDEIENVLANMEGSMAKLFYHWTEEKLLYPPPPDTNGFKLLKRFILYQTFRIPKSGNDITESLNQGMKAIVKEFKPELWDSIKNSRLVHDNPVLLMLLHSFGREHLLDFLDCKFLVNLSPLPFITSDAPVVFYNQLMEQAGNYIGSTGLVAKGLQIFYPIHPRLMICLYDPNIYDFGNGCENCYGTESVEEIHQLNGLQLINSKSQIFFDEMISQEYISELYNNYCQFLGTAKKFNQIINSGNRKFIFIGSEDAHIDLNLDFYSLKKNPDYFKDMLAPLRHPSLKRPKGKQNDPH